MPRFPFLALVVALALPAAGRCESLDIAAGLAWPSSARVVRGPSPQGMQAGWAEPPRFAARARFDATGESDETGARAAVVVVRGAARRSLETTDMDVELQLALVGMLTGLCRIDPSIRDAAAEGLLAPLRASF